jgi:spore coat protein U-like protein
MKKILTIIGLLSLSYNYAYAGTTSNSITATTKASATLASVCTISSQNINFGQISLPVGSQNATSSMTVQCTKGSSYTIGLAYGGVYGGTTSNSSVAYYVPDYTNASGYHIYNEYNSSGTFLGQYGSLNAPPNTTTNNDGQTWVVNTPVYGYGVMNGAVSGDIIAYEIQVPNKPSEVWNTGNYTYTATGTGNNDTIPVVATLMPSKTPNTYPTVDTYLDTVTATVSY